ncbi:NYN domain-containing protein [Patulibacter sp. S7RM1-6]
MSDSRMLLLWDSPNIDMVLGQLILRRKPTGRERPRIDALADWLRERADAIGRESGERPRIEASVFANVTERTFNGVLGWAEVVRQAGFRMFLKPKTREDSDVDDDILDLLAQRHREGGLTEAILMSHDGMALVEAAKTLLADGVAVTALVFPEHANQLVQVDGIEVVDLEDVPGLFGSPLPRLTFGSLPAEGRWLEPLGEL